MQSSDGSPSPGWFTPRAFVALTKRETDWTFDFDDGTQLAVECLWRLLERGRICVTSKDDAQQFGLPSPLDSAAEVNGRLSRCKLTECTIRDGTLDLEIRFEDGHVLQVLPDSSGYESWKVQGLTHETIACGGGTLAIFPNAAALFSDARPHATRDPSPVAYLNYRLIVDCLRELSDQTMQERLWMSTGGEVSSFTEAVEQLFSDSGLSEAMRKGKTGLGDNFDKSLLKLDSQLRRVNGEVGPRATIDDPEMRIVRTLAIEALMSLPATDVNPGLTPKP